MMKKIPSLLILLSYFILVGCTKNPFRASDLEPSTAVITEGEIRGSIKEGSIQSLEDKITLVFDNLTATDFYYGVPFTLEVELEKAWYRVPFDKNVAFIEIAMILKRNSSDEEVVELATYFDKLPVGKYRIVKDFQTENKTVTIASTFEILEKSYY